MSYFTDTLNRFRKLPQAVKDAVGGVETLEVIEILEEQYKVPLGFLVILITIGDVTLPDIETYLIGKYKLGVDAADDIAHVIKDEIFAPIIEESLNNSVMFFPYESLAERKKRFINMFSKDIVWLFAENYDITDWLNDMLMKILADELNEKKQVGFEMELAEALSDNQEKLTDKAILIEGKRQPGVISNWLKDFISKNGSGYYSSMTLSEYLVNSGNTRSLDQSEKTVLKSILILYRNLRYFEESLEANNGQLQIIPVATGEESDQSKNQPNKKRDIKAMTKIELKLFMEENNLTEEDIKKMQLES